MVLLSGGSAAQLDQQENRDLQRKISSSSGIFRCEKILMAVGVRCSPAQAALNCPLERKKKKKTKDGKQSFLGSLLMFHVHPHLQFYRPN